MGNHRDDIDWIAVKARYAIGKESNRQIAQDLNISESAIRARAKREKWTKGAQLSAHVDKRIEVETKRKELLRQEKSLPASVRDEVNKAVWTETVWRERLVSLQGSLVEDVLSMWDRDKEELKNTVGPVDNAMYAKAELVSKITTQAKKNMIGDKPLLSDDDNGEGDEILVIPVPKAEADRVNKFNEDENE